MARPRKGKPLTLRPIRLDDDVWAECQRLGKEHGTINEGLRTRLLGSDLIVISDEQLTTPYTVLRRRSKSPLLKPKDRNK